MLTFFQRLEIPLVQANNIGSTDVIISNPAGAGTLPGAGNEGADIGSNIIFAKVIPFIIRWGINLAIALSVIAFIIGGYIYLTAFGNEEKYDKALKTIIYAGVGLILSLTAYGIVAIISRIQFS